jgi:hypothetical protein
MTRYSSSGLFLLTAAPVLDTGGTRVSTSSDPTPNKDSRRGFLAKLGVGTAVAWTVPTVLSSPAQAQASGANVPVFVCSAGLEVSPGDDVGVVDVSSCGFQTGDLLLAATAIHIDTGHPWDIDPPLGWASVGDPLDAATGSPDSGIHGHLFSYNYAGETDYSFTRVPVPPNGGASAHWTVLIVGYHSDTGDPTVSVVDPGVAEPSSVDISFPSASITDPHLTTIVTPIVVDTSPDITFNPIPTDWISQAEIGTGPHPEAFFADTTLPPTPNPGTLAATTWPLDPVGTGHIIGWQVAVVSP